jgi:hypothetical protein
MNDLIKRVMHNKKSDNYVSGRKITKGGGGNET